MTTSTTKPTTQKERLQAAAARSKKPIISLNNSIAVASSYRIAEFFGLPHDTLLHLYQAAQDRSINDLELAEFYLQNLKNPLFGNGYDLTREAFIHFSEPPQYGDYPEEKRAEFIALYDDFTANIIPTTPVIIAAPAHYDDTKNITVLPQPAVEFKHDSACYMREDGKLVTSTVCIHNIYKIDRKQISADIEETKKFFPEMYAENFFSHECLLNEFDMTEKGFLWIVQQSTYQHYHDQKIIDRFIEDFNDANTVLIQHPITAQTTLTTEQAALVAEINLLNEQTEASKTQTLIYAARTGAKLAEAKEKVGHGNFRFFCNQHCKMSFQTISNYMKLAKKYPQLLNADANIKLPLHLLDITTALEMLSVPKSIDHDDKEQFQEAVEEAVTLLLENGEKVTKSDVKQLKQNYEHLAKDTKKVVDANAELEKENIELQSDIESKAAEIDRLEKELDELVKQGGVDALVSESTAASQTKINTLTSEITFLQSERTAAIERGVAIELLKKEQEVKALDDTIMAKSSTLETIESRISYRNKADSYNSQHQQNATTLFKALSACELFISTTNTPENALLDHQAIKAITETAKKCQQMAEVMNNLASFKQQEIDNAFADWTPEPEIEPDYFYYITQYEVNSGYKILRKFEDSKTKKDALTTFEKVYKKMGSDNTRGYRSTKAYTVGDILPHLIIGNDQYQNGQFIYQNGQFIN